MRSELSLVYELNVCMRPNYHDEKCMNIFIQCNMIQVHAVLMTVNTWMKGKYNIIE